MTLLLLPFVATARLVVRAVFWPSHVGTCRRQLSIAASAAVFYDTRSDAFIPTMSNVPAEAAIPSHKLLLRAGFMRKSSLGTYTLLPLAVRSISKIECIIDDEMKRIGCSKVRMPSLLHSDQWKQTGRWESTGAELFRLKDRRGDEYCLGPTHEEVVTALVASEVTSHRQLPQKLYQIGPKYRDEIRPRFGLQRAREFIMKDLYSFDKTKGDAMETYKRVQEAYHRIFQRLSVPYTEVEAFTGNIGGSMSHEFHILSEVGEDTLLSCSACGYAANSELAVGGNKYIDETAMPMPIQATSLLAAELEGLPINVTWFMKKDDPGKTYVGVLSHADRQLNTVKLGTHMDLESYVRLKTSFLDTPASASISFIVDDGLRSVVTLNHDTVQWGDVTVAAKSDPCRCGKGHLEEHRGIEVGHVFLLGTKYSAALDATYVGEDQKKHLIEMGCFGLGVSRILSGVVESSHDERGIVWPWEIAPYKVAIMSAGKSKSGPDVVASIASQLGEQVPGLRHDILVDDRWNDGFGYKIMEAELVGYPYVVVVGQKYAKEQKVELQNRRLGTKSYQTVEELIHFLGGLC